MASDPTAVMHRAPARGPLRVGLYGPEQLVKRAAWALEALLARARILEWELVDPDAPDQADMDLVWGSCGAGSAPALQLRFDPDEWKFTGAAPDAVADPLAATFWWLARVEEQLAPTESFDQHGRFRHAASALARGDDPLAVPVDEIAVELAERLAPWVVARAETEPTWRLVATHDIDLPWRWTRSGRRRAVRLLRHHLRRLHVRRALRIVGVLLAIPVWHARRTDPWSNARDIAQLEAAAQARSTSYLLVGREAPEDGDAQLHARGGARYAGELVALDEVGDAIGLHGSYTASTSEGRLDAERAAIEQLVGREVRDHRFHYLRHRPVEAWPALVRAGLRTDCSLGFAEQPGFRAGTAHPYRAWDHSAGAPLDLVVIPLALMDASFDERYLDVRERGLRALHCVELLDRIARHGGSASLLVHNDRLCNRADEGWTRLYRALLGHVRRRGGVACTAHEAAEAYLRLLPVSRRRA